MRVPEIQTDRLLLRAIKDSDIDCFYEMCSDPEVMEFFPSVMSRQETEEMMGRMNELAEKNGYCFEVVADKRSGEPFGFVGLNVPRYQDQLHFGPCVEIGWRLKRSCWGKGIAVEAANAWLEYGFNHLGLEEIVAFTAKGNKKSQRVMEKLGMSYSAADDFEMPMLEKEHPLRSHVLYRLRSSDFSKVRLLTKG
ncbi:GNAT family N-acetyltransferase [Polycladidibacter hongkongensis]|uniref:GNAT family N-acetyltransferase n=1 Tax=Polycladidibacter hongkongensis TaxID=1647556 RepID=UPI0008347D37|nr:GNAT family N-acetyltransferase [Pseudovibrio hongkongensis]